jgi:hypothetical protein
MPWFWVVEDAPEEETVARDEDPVLSGEGVTLVILAEA